MFAVRCGVSLEDNLLNPEKDWHVLKAEINSKLNPVSLLDALQIENSTHIFTSSSAFSIFQNLIQSFPVETKKRLKNTTLNVCGVGTTTDHLVKSLADKDAQIRWLFPNLNVEGRRENGLQWTLEQLEKIGLLPKSEVTLWCKVWSFSEKILNEYKSMRHWTTWKTSIFEIYNLTLVQDAIPPEVVLALTQRRPICFGVKSADVLDATVELLKKHLQKSSVAELPKNIFFSVWEKSALQRAQQLFLQSRLVSSLEFESFLNARERQE